MAKLVSRTYGDALFELAVEENRVDELSEEIQVLTEILEQNKDFEKIMVHPEIPQEQKLSVIDEVFKGRVSDALTGFLRIVAAKGRYKELPGIFAYFTARVKEYKKIGVAEVTSAIPLTGVQKQKVEQKLLQTTPYETMEIEYKVDAAKIGGLMIRIGDRVVDGTVSSRLAALTSCLMKISLESEKEGVQAS